MCTEKYSKIDYRSPTLWIYTHLFILLDCKENKELDS